MTGHVVTTEAELDALYGTPVEASLIKEVPGLTAPYRAFVEAAPFFALATVAAEGLDCSPRGDPAGFVRVLDDRTLAIPDRRGNNRIDSLRNIVRDPRVALMFLIPGKGEALRINGRARISTDPALCESFAVDGHLPRTVTLVAIDTVYFQCARALIRSGLWTPETWPVTETLPTAGQMLKAARQDFDAASYDSEAVTRLPRTLY
ncbi:pyridoxamine 5'-phosphate oxidase family protein [uncultured Tistrella sp.]|uniref:pyridoxamine 5'-phosphate oxidase family protein n=1 Tax=Tistrella mobilis TaxID=171437 RepID=UPI000C0AFDFE|nr:pyridoxamine 5'-phosphate oxidase family protein [uncultured Tistrella sp.]MAM73953.1 pyridoxamine 5'-phosphate oxidase [Tistrella sp.]